MFDLHLVQRKKETQNKKLFSKHVIMFETQKEQRDG